jgi:hypothetical protein
VGRCFLLSEEPPEDDEWEPVEHANLCDFRCGESDDVGGSLMDVLYGFRDGDDKGECGHAEGDSAMEGSEYGRDCGFIPASREEDMPLVKGKKARTREGFSENVRREMTEGNKPQKQAVAIAYSEARRGDKSKRKRG